MSYVWSKEDVEELKILVKEGKSKEFLAEHFNRTETAIEVKVNRLGLQLLRDNRNWLEKDLEEFKEDWLDGTISKPMLIKKYKRSHFSLRKKALELGLGVRPYNDEYITIRVICEEMNVSHDRVSNWLKLGLKCKKNRSGRTKYLITQEDLLSFLEEHQDMFNANEVSSYLFPQEPEWFKQKRKADAEFYASKLRAEYSDAEDRQMISMFKRGISNKEIATRLKRTESAICGRLRLLGYTRKEYNDYEIEVLKENSRYMTLDELAKLLPLRTKKGIEYKCRQLDLPYHYVKERCESRDR